MRAQKNKYYVYTLCLIFLISLAVPFCCHADTSFNASQSLSQPATHAHHHLSDCTCGHQFRKEITKVDNTVAKSLQKVSSSVVSTNNLLPQQTKKFIKVYNPTFFLRSNPDPPIHLLNSVFLN